MKKGRKCVVLCLLVTSLFMPITAVKNDANVSANIDNSQNLLKLLSEKNVYVPYHF